MVSEQATSERKERHLTAGPGMSASRRENAWRDADLGWAELGRAEGQGVEVEASHAEGDEAAGVGSGPREMGRR